MRKCMPLPMIKLRMSFFRCILIRSCFVSINFVFSCKQEAPSRLFYFFEMLSFFFVEKSKLKARYKSTDAFWLRFFSPSVKKKQFMFFACAFPQDGNFQAIDSTRVASPFLCISHSDLLLIGAVTISTSSMMVTRMSVHQLLLLGGCKRRLDLWRNQTMQK